MSATIPTQEPVQVRAGETLAFTKTLTDYSAAAGWSISYSFRSLNGSALDFSSTASGATHVLNVPFATTAGWLPARYYGVGMVSNGTTKTQIFSGYLDILPNIAAQTEGYDVRSPARIVLDNIESVIAGRATSSVLNSTVEGTTLQRIPIEQLLKLRDRYKQIVLNEEAAERARNGLSASGNIFSRFTLPK
jgi:hypothetical protein